MDDDVNHHRRYSKKDLHSKLKSANFEIWSPDMLIL